MQPTLHISLLGDFKVMSGDEPVASLKSPRLQALVAYLLLHNEAPQSRQHIAFLFWPESTEEQAQTNLRKLLVSLRASLPNAASYIAFDRRTLQWQRGSPCTLDVAEFERALHLPGKPDFRLAASGGVAPEQIPALRAAVDLYAGDLLPGCYDEWIMAPRERLRQAHLEALQRLVSALEASGDLGSAILYARRLLRHDPLQEENYRRLMQLYAANGDGAAAVAVYRQCAAFLKRELGVQPGPATVEVLRRVEETIQSSTRTGLGRRPRQGHALTGGQPAQTAGGPPTPDYRLPAPTTLFIGREKEVSVLSELLVRSAVRLVTLTGTAGTGKTRLALQVAAGLVALLIGANTFAGAPFPDGIFFVPLASVDEAELLPTLIARTLGLTVSGSLDVVDSLLEYLRGKSLLLLLDNFEHLMEGSSLVTAVLSACPGVKVLVTSRAVLNLSGEHEYLLPPMQVPSKEALSNISLTPEDMAQYEGVALFIERAAEVSPGFALTRTNSRTISEICRTLEGLPLAIELAAARLKALSPEAILSRLDRRLKLLVGGKADLPPRQRALATAIEWSYNLLDPDEQALFRAVSVFAGGFTLEAAAAVAGKPEAEVLEGVTSLLNKSLLMRSDWDSSDSRFTMLETLREYGQERLRESAEEDNLQRRHASYYLHLAEAIDPADWVSEQAARVGDRIEVEQDNMRAALGWACAREEPAIALRLAGALGEFWQWRGHWAEGRIWLDRALNVPFDEASRPEATRRARALLQAGKLAGRQRDRGAAERLLEECRVLCRLSGDDETLGAALSMLAVVALEKPDYEGALEIHAEGLALHRKLGDKWRIATSLHNMSFVKMLQGELPAARALSLEAQALFREAGATLGVGYTHYVLGNITTAWGDYDGALDHFREAARAARQMENRFLLASSLLALAEVTYRRCEYESANVPLREAQQLYDDLGDAWGATSALIRLGRDALRRADYNSAGEHFSKAFERALVMEHDHLASYAVAGLAALACDLERLEEAARLYSRAQTLSPDVFASSPIAERPVLPDVPAHLARARAALGDEAWQAACSEGATVSDSAVLEVARTLR